MGLTSFRFLFILIFGLFYSNINSQETTENLQKEWVNALSNQRELEVLYTETSGLLFEEMLYVGFHKINTPLKILSALNLNEYNKEKTFQIREIQKIETGVYSSKDGLRFTSIIGWKKRESWTKEFELIIEKRRSANKSMNAFLKDREQWELLANKHNPELLVATVFCKSGQYFNRGRIYNGKEVIDAYSYMKDPAFKIKLESMHVTQINQHTILEVGTFTTGGKGLYILIWRKEGNKWKVLLDFNF